MPAGPDAALGAQYAGKLNILTAPITNSYDTQETSWVTALASGQSWSQAATGLVVRLSSVSGGFAHLTVCRKGGAETAATCAAGTDNDCNGLVGAADPACAAFQPRTTPSSPPPSPAKKPLPPFPPPLAPAKCLPYLAKCVNTQWPSRHRAGHSSPPAWGPCCAGFTCFVGGSASDLQTFAYGWCMPSTLSK